MRFFKKQSFESVLDSVKKSHALEKNLNGFDLILLGLGFIVGTGVFALTGMVAAEYAGPAVILSYAIAGLTCIFVALAYTELAVMMPTSGSVYSYSYVAFGEIFAWLMGGTMILVLGIGGATVSGSWSAYIVNILKSGGVNLPHELITVPAQGGIINLPAILITVFIGIFLHLGTKDSKMLNAILVFIKMAAIFIFIVIAAPHFDAKNWENFMPYSMDSVLVGSSVLFFAFTGFGGLSAAAEECKNPKRDLTIGIIGSLLLSTTIYIIIAGLLTGIAPYKELSGPDALAHALAINGSNIGSAIIATGAICGFTTVLLMQLYTITRVLYVISRDGLLPQIFSKIHPKYHSPYITIWAIVFVVSLLGGFCEFKLLAQLSSMGSLIEYSAIMTVVMLLRKKMPEVPRTFKCPAVFIIAPIGLFACIYLLFKQIIDENGSLMQSGEMLIYWFGAITILYFIRCFSLPSVK